MGDLISRQAAIDAVKEMCRHYTPTKSVTHPHIDFVVETLESLPSAEPKIKCIAKVTMSQEQIQDAVDKAVEKMKAELEPCDFCKHKDDCGDMALYCPSERRTDE